MLLLMQWKRTQHISITSNSLGIKHSFTFAPGSHLENLCIFKDNLLVSTWTTWRGRTRTPGKLFLNSQPR